MSASIRGGTRRSTSSIASRGSWRCRAIYFAGLTPEQLALLPESCRAIRIKAEDDIEYWTYRLSAMRLEDISDSALVHDIFMHLLHASLRIAQIHRLHAARHRVAEPRPNL
jgi:hypothetical protein